jgi:hypothetical protein
MWTRRYPESQLGNYHVITIIAMLTFAVDSLMDWASLHQSGAQVVQIVTLVFPQLLRSLPPHLLPLLCLAPVSHSRMTHNDTFSSLENSPQMFWQKFT